MVQSIIPTLKWLAFAIIVLALLPLVLTDAARQWMFSEEGPVEWFPVAMWLLAAILILWRSTAQRAPATAYAIFCVTLVTRETGLPPELIPSGKRLLKIAYYLDGSVPLLRRVIIGLIIVTVLIALAYFLLINVRAVFSRRQLRDAGFQLVMLCGGVLVASQGFEALSEHLPTLPAQARNTVVHVFWALEEGLEALAPVVLIQAVRVAGRLPVPTLKSYRHG